MYAHMCVCSIYIYAVHRNLTRMRDDDCETKIEWVLVELVFDVLDIFS